MEIIDKNKIVKGQVTGITKYGVFVSLEDDYTGMVHISEVSNKFIPDLKSMFKIGDIINVKILSVDESTNHVNLSIKKIDYKLKTQENKIEEVGQGFELLKNNLNKWVKTKMLSLKEK